MIELKILILGASIAWVTMVAPAWGQSVAQTIEIQDAGVTEVWFNVPRGNGHYRLELHIHAKTILGDPVATLRLQMNPEDNPQNYNGVAMQWTANPVLRRRAIGEIGHGLGDITLTSISSDTSVTCWIPNYAGNRLKKDIRCSSWSVTGFFTHQLGPIASGGVRTHTSDPIHSLLIRLDSPLEPDNSFWIGSTFRLEVH